MFEPPLFCGTAEEDEFGLVAVVSVGVLLASVTGGTAVVCSGSFIVVLILVVVITGGAVVVGASMVVVSGSGAGRVLCPNVNAARINWIFILGKRG